MVHYKKLKFKTNYFWCINTDRTTLQNLQMDCLHNLCPHKSIHPQQIFCSNESHNFVQGYQVHQNNKTQYARNQKFLFFNTMVTFLCMHFIFPFTNRETS